MIADAQGLLSGHFQQNISVGIRDLHAMSYPPIPIPIPPFASYTACSMFSFLPRPPVCPPLFCCLMLRRLPQGQVKPHSSQEATFGAIDVVSPTQPKLSESRPLCLCSSRLSSCQSVACGMEARLSQFRSLVIHVLLSPTAPNNLVGHYRTLSKPNRFLNLFDRANGLRYLAFEGVFSSKTSTKSSRSKFSVRGCLLGRPMLIG